MEPALVEPGEVVLHRARHIAADTNPALVYLSQLDSPASERTMKQSLRAIADGH